MSNEWVMVPREPTRDMIVAGAEHTDSVYDNEPYRAQGQAIAVYKDMLDAAPAAPVQQAEPVGYFLFNSEWNVWEQMAAKFQNDSDAVQLYRHPPPAEPASAFQLSAPERIWLNVGDINVEDRFEDVSNDGAEWICWCEDSVYANDVPYVRADLAHPPAAEVQRLREALKPFAAIDLTTKQAVDPMDVLRARGALKGGE